MKHFFFLCLGLLFCGGQQLFAQDFEFGKFLSEDLNIKHVPFDSTANAVVLREFGTASFQLDDNTGRSYINYEYHVKIKIFNKQGFDEANIQIPLWTYNSSMDEISGLTAVTMNFTETGLRKTELNQKGIFTDNKSKYLRINKFTMPDIQEGSVIEYKYRIKRPYIFNFVTWEFQSGLPKLHSEFIGFIPPIYNFNASIRGFLKLTDQKAVISKDCLRINGTNLDCSKMTYIMKDIPSFIEESYMTAASNFKSAIYFELSDVQHLRGGNSKITKTWKDVDYELISDKSFGGQLKKKDLFKPLLPEILKNASDDLSKANAIYDYIKKNIKWNNYLGKYSENDIKKALELHSGNIGDINLALIAALSAADLNVEALILSTRSNGTINNIHPVISDFNYVVAKLNIGDKSYLLDASQPFLPFGLLPHHCINERGRVLGLKSASYWYDLKASQKDLNYYNFDGNLALDGKITGNMRISSLGYSALNKRESIAEAGSLDAFVESFDEKMTNIRILKHKFTNIDSLNKELIEEYEIEMQLSGDLNVDQLYFNPYIIDRNIKNPFNLNERLYPVDLGAVTEKMVTMNLKVPSNFVMVEKPKDISLTLPNADAKYLNRIAFQPGEIKLLQLLQLNKPVYQADEYLTLKEFYSRIIQQQTTDLILKKAN
ncbi:transglutaminase domain-containing protein [Pedobacter immunditicola]|uniref:transglutaminase domain-containing protein n=1 Tax=Pedobacter immunditicola TaxID=3133440 RepID=UPI0030A25D0D